MEQDKVEIVEESDEKKENRKHPILKELFDWVMVVAVAVAIALVINNFIITNAYIPSSSMHDTIKKGDKVIGLRTSYWFSSPKRGDIVIFLYPDDESKNYIKRVIGEPGDKVEIKDGLVYINDSEEPLVEPYVYGEPTGNFGPYTVPEGCYFMLGDNREVSKDSRYWNNPYVEEEKILAKAVFRYWTSDEEQSDKGKLDFTILE